MEQTKIQEILNKLREVPGFNVGRISDEFLVQLVYPLFQKPNMPREDAVEFTRIVLGIKDPKEKEFPISKEDKEILLKLTGDKATYGDEKEDVEKLNEINDIFNSNSGSINPNPYNGGANYNPGLDNEYVTKFILKNNKDYNFDNQRRFIIDPPDLLRNKKINTSLISNEIIKNGYNIEGTKDKYDYWGNLIDSDKSGIKQKTDYYLGGNDEFPLNYDEYDDYKKEKKTDPKYAKKAKNVQRTEEEKLNQKRLKQELKNRICELMAVSNSTKEELTRLMTVSAPGILATIAAVVAQTSALAAGAPYTSAAIVPTLKAGLKAVKDVKNSILTELDTIKGLGVQFISGIYELGNGPELNALFSPCVAMFTMLDSIFSIFGESSGVGSAIQNAEESESNKQRRIFKFDFTKPLINYNPGNKSNFVEEISLTVDDKEYTEKNNTMIQLNDNKSLTFNGILHYEENLYIEDIRKIYEYDNNNITIDVYNNDGSLKDSYIYELYITDEKEVEYTGYKDNPNSPGSTIPETRKGTVYSFGLREKNNKKTDDFIITIVKDIINLNEQNSYKDTHGTSCIAKVYIINGKNIKINSKDFEPIKLETNCDECFEMNNWDRVEGKKFKDKNGKIFYNEPGDKVPPVELKFDGLYKVEKIDDKRTAFFGGNLGNIMVGSYSQLNIFGSCAYLEKDEEEKIIKEEKYFEIASLNVNFKNSKGVNDPPDEKNYSICDCRDPLQALKDNTNYTENDEGERYYSFEVKDDAKFLQLLNLNGAIFEKIEIENFQDVIKNH